MSKIFVRDSEFNDFQAYFHAETIQKMCAASRYLVITFSSSVVSFFSLTLIQSISIHYEIVRLAKYNPYQYIGA